MDLNAPLGLDPPRKSRRRLVLIGCASAAAIGLCALGTYFASAYSGAREPFVVAAIPPDVLVPPPSQLPHAAAIDPTPTASVVQASPKPDAAGDSATMEHGVKVVRASPPNVIGGAPGAAQGPLIIDVTRSLDGPHHPGKPLVSQPSETHATATIPAGDQGPRVAIFVEGQGLDDKATRVALEAMPAAVDLAFVPYGATIAASVATAKAKGHEVLLQLPMENGQGASFGPHMLRPGEPAAALAEDINWLTSQFSGYAGVTNLLGAPVTADGKTMTAVLKAVAARGLFYVDDGTSRRSLASSLAPDIGVTVLRADIVLDATSDKDKVRANLDNLVALARRRGSAIGMASGLPDHLGTIAKFAAGLAGQGVTLVPLSAFVGSPLATATAK